MKRALGLGEGDAVIRTNGLRWAAVGEEALEGGNGGSPTKRKGEAWSVTVRQVS